MKYTASSLVEALKYNFGKVKEDIPLIIDRPVFYGVLPEKQQERALSHLTTCKNAVDTLQEVLSGRDYFSAEGRGKSQNVVQEISSEDNKGLLEIVSSTGLHIDDMIITALIGTLTQSQNKRKDSSEYVVHSMRLLMADEGSTARNDVVSMIYPRNIKLRDIYLATLVPHVICVCGNKEEPRGIAAQMLYSVWDEIRTDENAKKFLRSLPHSKKISVISRVFEEVPDPYSINGAVLKEQFQEFF